MDKRVCVICNRLLSDNDFEYSCNVCKDCGEEISQDNPYTFDNSHNKDEDND